MGNQRVFERNGKSGAFADHVTKRFAVPTLGLEDVYFTWGTVSDAARYIEVVDKLKEYVAVHFLRPSYGRRESHGGSPGSCLYKDRAAG